MPAYYGWHRKSPDSVSAESGLETIAAEAAMSLATSLSGKSAVNSRRFHSDLPQLPIHLPEVREAPQRPTAFPLLTVP
jgi:hypothetical protein